MNTPHPLALRYIMIGGVALAMLLNVATALLMSLAFRLLHKRPPTRGEAWRIVIGYGALLAVLYLGLLGMMTLQNAPGPMAIALFVLHYLCYPVLAGVILLRRTGGHS
jgi:uncharacterized RDD family membrane protein YckC